MANAKHRFSKLKGSTAHALGTFTALALASTLTACGSSSDEQPAPPPHQCVVSSEASCHDQIDRGLIPEADYDTCRGQTLRDCSTQYYLRDYDQLDLTSCGPSGSTMQLDQAVDLALFRGSGIADARVPLHTQGLQRWWEGHSVWFFANEPSRIGGMGYALSGTRAEFEAALRARGIDPNGPLDPDRKEEAERIIGDVLFAPVKSFLNAHALPARHRVNVVVLSHVASPTLAPELGIDGVLAGLALSPALLDAVDATDPEYSLWNMIGVTGEFTPTLFVGADDVEHYLRYPDKVIAHEMGHALGLPHTSEPGNLMTQGLQGDCRAELDDSQLGGLTLPYIRQPEDGIQQIARLPARILSALAAR